MGLDEVTQICPVPLPHWLSDSGGKGIQIIAVVHGEAQLTGRWGDHGRQVVLDTSSVKMFLPGITDVTTLDAAAKLCGQASWKVRGQDHATRHDVATPDMIRQLPAGFAAGADLRVHATSFRYTGDADPSAPGGIAAVYRDLVADDARTRQVAGDVVQALDLGRHCLVLPQRTAHIDRLAASLRERGQDPVILRGGMGAKARATALARLQPQPGGSPLLAVAAGPYIGEGFDCPALDTLFLAAPIAFKGRPVQYAGRILRPHPGKITAEIHDYHDQQTGVLAASPAKRAPGYISLSFPDPRRLVAEPSTRRPDQSRLSRGTGRRRAGMKLAGSTVTICAITLSASRIHLGRSTTVANESKSSAEKLMKHSGRSGGYRLIRVELRAYPQSGVSRVHRDDVGQ
jgi:TraM recognition site of TraD and TraG